MIELHTKLHNGIYASQGGGQDVIHQRWTTGPRNLVAAINTLEPHRQEMLRGYGNIGCGHSWLSVDGVALDEADCAGVLCAEEIRRDHDRQGYSASPRPGSKTDEARLILSRLEKTQRVSVGR